MKRLFLTAVSALLAFSAVPASAATLIGDQIKVSWRLPTESQIFAFGMSPSSTVIVGPGIEGVGQLTNVSMSIDFDAASIALTFLSDANFSTNAFNGIYFQQLGAGTFGEIADVSGIAASLVHDMNSALSINFSGKKFTAGDTVKINFVPDVPEVATWAMLLVGLAMVGGGLRVRPHRYVLSAIR